MYNKQRIKETIKRLGVEKYVVYTGGSMVMQGLKEETNDLDVGVYPDDFKRLSEGSVVTIAPFTKERMIQLGDTEVFEMGIRRVPTKDVDGVTVQVLRSVYAWKMEMNREKDRDDMLKIAEFLLPEGLK